MTAAFVQEYGTCCARIKYLHCKIILFIEKFLRLNARYVSNIADFFSIVDTKDETKRKSVYKHHY